MNVSHYIAKRLLRGRSDEPKLSGPVVAVATAAVVLGVVVMIVALSVGLGFKQEIRDNVVGFGTHIQIVNFDNNQSYETNPIRSDSTLESQIRSIDGVRGVQAFILKPGIIKTKEAEQGIALKGVDEGFDWNFIKSKCVEGSVDSALCATDYIVLSSTTADALKLEIGDAVRMYFIQEGKIRARRYTLRAIFNSHFPEFDEAMAFVDMDGLRKLNGWEEGYVSGYEVLLNDFDKLDAAAHDAALIASMRVAAGDSFMRVLSIRDMQPQIFGWLDLLDMNIVVILVLIICVASLNMVSGLLILILENTNTIGLLKSMGARNGSVRGVFLYMAVHIIGKGMIIGNVVGLAICLFQQTTGWMTLDPENYYLDTVPILISPSVLLGMNVGTLLLTTLILIGPSQIVARISPAKSIRFN